jgi:3-hydroxyisobutyrate dehydrogenase-like beta-hydroxyacid dehydrogenase
MKRNCAVKAQALVLIAVSLFTRLAWLRYLKRHRRRPAHRVLDARPNHPAATVIAIAADVEIVVVVAPEDAAVQAVARAVSS